MDRNDLTVVRGARGVLATEAACLLTEYSDTKHRPTLVMASIVTAAASVLESLLVEYDKYSKGEMPDQVPTVITDSDVIRIHGPANPEGDAA